MGIEIVEVAVDNIFAVSNRSIKEVSPQRYQVTLYPPRAALAAWLAIPLHLSFARFGLVLTEASDVLIRTTFHPSEERLDWGEVIWELWLYEPADGD